MGSKQEQLVNCSTMTCTSSKEMVGAIHLLSIFLDLLERDQKGRFSKLWWK